MARLQLSKATLSKERKKLASYQRFLPSLDMKRQQLLLELKACERQQQQLQQTLDDKNRELGREIPMLANERVSLDGLCRVVDIQLETRSVAGVWVKSLRQVQIERAAIPLLGKPHWVVAVQLALEAVLQLRVEQQVLAHQRQLLGEALKKITQRVNLFDKVLIPRAQANIKRIQIHLDDRAREAVITSKIAKNRHGAGEAISEGEESSRGGLQ